MNTWVLLALMALSGVCHAQVYTYLDAQGNPVYTDKPRKGAVPVKVPEGNRMSVHPLRPAPPSSTTPAPRNAPKAKTRVPHYEMLRVLVPLPDGTVSNAGGEVIVTLTSEPGLAEGDRYRVLLDDAPVGEPGPSPVIALHGVDRGTHQLAAEIIDSQGVVIERTPPQPLHVQRTSLAQKRRIHPCEKDDYGVRPECPLSSKPDEDD